MKERERGEGGGGGEGEGGGGEGKGRGGEGGEERGKGGGGEGEGEGGEARGEILMWCHYYTYPSTSWKESITFCLRILYIMFITIMCFRLFIKCKTKSERLTSWDRVTMRFGGI